MNDGFVGLSIERQCPTQIAMSGGKVRIEIQGALEMSY
jgi:hypothetical protein